MERKSKNIFINLPVKDLEKTMDFFIQLGFRFDMRFTNSNAACLILGDNIFTMFLLHDSFKTFTDMEISDTSKYTEVLLSISLDTKEEVDEFVNKAFSLGAKSYSEPNDHGWMYQWGFKDLDGHIWEVMYANEIEPLT